jgi:exodeoxyribonuclease III
MKRYAIYVLIITFVVPGCFLNPGKRNNNGDNLRIVSYNVWYGFTLVPERKEKWIDWMKEQQPDVVSLQELNEYTSLKLAEDAKRYGHEYSVLLKEDGFPTGITSKFPIEDVKKVREGFHHGLLRARVQNIYFYVIHLHPSNHETRKKEIALILSDIEQLPAGSEVILAGDFNTFSPFDSVYYAHSRLEIFFRERDKMYNERNLNNGRLDYDELRSLMGSGLVDMEAESRTSTYNFTGSFPTKLVKEGDHGDRRRLDYVLASKELARKVQKAEIISDDATHALSDHLPVVVEIIR